MIKIDKLDINSMNIEQLKEYAISLENKVETEKKRADEAINALNKLLVEFKDKKNIIRRYNLERFVGSSDNIGIVNDKEKIRSSNSKENIKKGGRTVNSKNFNMSDDELEKLAKDNEPIYYDPINKIPEDERYMYVKVSEDTSYQLEIVQKRIIVRKIIRDIYKKNDGTFLKEMSHAPILGSMASASILSDTLFMKYGLGVPHYRYENWLKTQQIPISTNTLYNWTRGACNALLPIYDEIKSSFKKAEVIHIDETPIRTLDSEDRINGYIFVFSAIIDGISRRLYHFSSDRKTTIVEEVLGKDYKGIIVVDGYDGYDKFSSLGMNIQRCLVHATRKFKDIVKGTPKKLQSKCHAKKVVAMFTRIFTDEIEIKQIGYKTLEDKLKLRNDPTRIKHVNELVEELENISKDYAADSLMKKAADYFLNDKESFLFFLKDARAPLDNSEAERTVKPYAIARRNFLFVRGKNGGDCSAIAMTMIQNAYINKIEPMSYLEVALSDAYKGNKDDLPWTESVKERTLEILKR